jgi:hypothetical protein
MSYVGAGLSARTMARSRSASGQADPCNDLKQLRCLFMRQREDLACHHAGRNNQIISSMSASGRTADGYQAMILDRAFRLTLNLPFSLNKKRDIPV